MKGYNTPNVYMGYVLGEGYRLFEIRATYHEGFVESIPEPAELRRTYEKTEKIVVARTPGTVKINLRELSKHELDTLCRAVLRLTEKALNDPKAAVDFKKWQKKRHKEMANA